MEYYVILLSHIRTHIYIHTPYFCHKNTKKKKLIILYILLSKLVDVYYTFIYTHTHNLLMIHTRNEHIHIRVTVKLKYHIFQYWHSARMSHHILSHHHNPIRCVILSRHIHFFRPKNENRGNDVQNIPGTPKHVRNAYDMFSRSVHTLSYIWYFDSIDLPVTGYDDLWLCGICIYICEYTHIKYIV